MSGCGGDENEKLEVQPNVVVDFPANLLRQKLIEKGTPGVDANTTVFGYRAYRIDYETVDEEGLPVKASGLMVVPTDYGVRDEDAKKLALMEKKGLSIVSDSHGTIFANREAPTELAKETMEPAGAPVVLTSLAGFVTLQADYIGFGSSAGHYHPYLLKHSSAAATVDFIKAARDFAQKKGIPLNGQLYVTGYSEGGYVAMAALQALEEAGEPVADAAPMAGPYMLDQMGKGVLALDTLPVPSFMADVAYAYALSYHQPITSLVKESYASKLPTLFDGNYTRPQIDAQLTHVTRELFTDEAITEVLDENRSYWFYGALLQNSTAYWGPKTPVQLVHCQGDDVVPYAISKATQNLMTNRLGAPSVTLVPVEATLTGDPHTSWRLGHAKCAPYAYGIAARIFSQVRRNTIGY
jgi:alpha-beta hydrolase superfamily lysophospholipase